MITPTTMLDATGAHVDLERLGPQDVRIEHIAHALGQVGRFCGSPRWMYSVAAHSLHVSHILEERGYTPVVQMAGLLHDAHEAYFGDMIGPVKALINRHTHGALRLIEAAIQGDVLRALGYWTAFCTHRRVIHDADMTALATERRDLMPRNDEPWPVLAGVSAHHWRLDKMITTADGPTASHFFMERYQELTFAIGEQREQLGQAPATAEPTR